MKVGIRASTKKRVILVTLFESQVVRNYLYNGRGKFFQEIKAKYEVIIITNVELAPRVKNFIDEQFSQEPIEVITIDKPISTFGYKLGQVFARCLNASKTNIWSIKRNAELGEFSHLGMMARLLINRLFSQNKNVIKLCRLLLKFNHGISERDVYTLNSKVPNSVLLTSATNYDWDARLGSYCNQENIKLISIPRSWDNLTSHGILRYEPNYLFTFTEPMVRHAENFHFLTKTKVLSGQNPAYQYLELDLEDVRSRKSKQAYEIVYACTGEAIYSNEIKLLMQMHDYFKKRTFNISVTVLEHPKFRYPNGIKEMLHNFVWVCLPYEDSFSNPSQLYEVLNSSDFVFTAGSSIVLDALFVHKFPVCVFIEVGNIKHWLSISRYTDTVQHFVEYLKESKVIQLKYIFDLFDFLQKVIKEPNSANLVDKEKINQLQMKFGLSGKSIASELLQIKE
jgi:hypothetical protein